MAMQNKEFLKEKKMKTIEEKLGDAVGDAKRLGIKLKELKEMLVLLYSEEEEE